MKTISDKPIITLGNKVKLLEGYFHKSKVTEQRTCETNTLEGNLNKKQSGNPETLLSKLMALKSKSKLKIIDNKIYEENSKSPQQSNKLITSKVDCITDAHRSTQAAKEGTSFNFNERVNTIISKNLKKSYIDIQDFYNEKSINDILFNKDSHLVAIFKDHLLYDDTTEFLRRIYPNVQSNERIIELCKYYSEYSKIFPNYIVLKENDYLYKNIRKKQKAIDRHQQELDNQDIYTDWNGNKFIDYIPKDNTMSFSLLSDSKFYCKFKGKIDSNEKCNIETPMQSYIKAQPSEFYEFSENNIAFNDLPLTNLLERLIKKDKKPIHLNKKRIKEEKIPIRIKKVVIENNPFWNHIKDEVSKYKKSHSNRKGYFLSSNERRNKCISNGTVIQKIAKNTNGYSESRNRNDCAWKRKNLKSDLVTYIVPKNMIHFSTTRNLQELKSDQVAATRNIPKGKPRMTPNPFLTKVEPEKGIGRRLSQRNRKVMTLTNDKLLVFATANHKSKELYNSTKHLVRGFTDSITPLSVNPKLKTMQKVVSVNIKELFKNLKKQKVKVDPEDEIESCNIQKTQRHFYSKYLQLLKGKMTSKKLNKRMTGTTRSANSKYFMTTGMNSKSFKHGINLP